MRFLLDTHILLWAARGSSRLPGKARALLENEANTLLFSPISIAEIAIKHDLGRADFPYDPAAIRQALLANDYQELPLTSAHALALSGLPPVHKDPFDRMLVAQAMAEGVRLVSHDNSVARYGTVVLAV